MYETVQQKFGDNAGSLVDLVFWWTMRCRDVSTSVKKLLNTTFSNRNPTNKWLKRRFRYNRTLNTNKANILIENLNLYFGELKGLMKNTPGLSDHLHVSFVMRLAEETVETLKKEFEMIDRAAILVGHDV